MAKQRTTLNPIRLLIEWTKRIVIETAAREMAEQATDATGYQIEPLALEHEADVPSIEYVEG